MFLTATLLVVSLSTSFCRANPVGWSPIAPINVPGRRFAPFAGGRQTFQSYPVSISVIPGNGGGFQQDDPFNMMPRQQPQQFMPPGFGPMGQMNPFGSPQINPLGSPSSQVNPMSLSVSQMNTMSQVAPGLGQNPLQAPSPFGFQQTGSSNSVLGPMGAPPVQYSHGAPGPQSGEQTIPMPQQPQQQVEGASETTNASTGQVKLPPFLEGTAKSIQNRFFEIVQNRNDPYMDKQKKLDELIQELDDDHKSQYNQFVESKGKEEEEKRQKVHTIVATMSDDAQTQFAKISTLLRNPNIGDADRWQKVQQVYDSMNAKLKEEFEAKFTAYG